MNIFIFGEIGVECLGTFCSVLVGFLRLRLFYLSHTQLHREYITSSEMYSLHLTHPKWTHTRAVGSHVTAPGEQLGVRCLAQGHLSRGIEGGYSPNNPCRTWDSNPQPSDYKSDSLSIRTRLPQGNLRKWNKNKFHCPSSQDTWDQCKQVPQAHSFQFCSINTIRLMKASDLPMFLYGAET